MQRRRRLRFTMVIAVLSAAALQLVAAPNAYAATTYYVDSAASCPGSGTSGAPYCNFDTVNTITFGAGDQILLKRGSQWNQQLTIQGSGTSGSHAVLTAYGSGNKPKIIRGGGTDVGIWMWNSSYWDVSNIEVGSALTGIGVYYSGSNTGTGLTFTDLYLHDIKGQYLHRRRVTDGVITSGSSTLSSASAKFVSTDVGRGVSGVGVPANTTIASVINSTTATMSASATASSSATIITYATNRNATDGVTTNGSSTLTSATANFTALDVGRQVAGTGIPTNTYIVSVTNSTTITMSANATATATGVSLTIGDWFVCQTTSSGTFNVDYSAGIHIFGCPVGDTQGGIVTNITMSKIEGYHNQTSIIMEYVDGALLKGLNLHDENAGGGVAENCWTALYLLQSKNLSIVNSLLNNVASCHNDNGTAAVISLATSYVNMSNSIINGVPDTDSPDESGFDYDWLTDHINLRNNFISNNHGNGTEILALPDRPGDYSTNNEISGNFYYSNGVNDMSDATIGWGAIRQYDNNITPTGTISNNLFQEARGFNSVQEGGTFSGFSFSGNRVFDTTATGYNSGTQFSGVQGTNNWYYEYRTSSSSAWTNLSTYASSAWSNGGGATDPQITQYWQKPGSAASCTTTNACDVSRTWSAPAAGKVTIRSRVLMSDTTCGDGVLARITKTASGTTTNLWPASGDTTVSNESNPIAGSAANADDVSVASGDKIRFVVNMNANADCDETSWLPSLHFSADNAYQWAYATTGGFEGWTVYSGTWSVASGKLSDTSSGGSVISPNYLGLDGATFDTLSLNITNNSGASRTGQIWYITAADTSWTLTKTFTVPSGTNTVTVDMTGTGWTSSPVKQFSLSPINYAGQVDINSITLTK